MPEKLNKAIAAINAAGSKAFSNAKAIPGYIGRFFKKPETQKAILTIFIFIMLVVVIALLFLWVMRIFLKSLAHIVNLYGIYLLGIFIVFCSFLEWINKKKSAAEERRKRELERLSQDAEIIYVYLRNFLFVILSDHFCRLTELCKPMTSFNLTETPPFHLERDIAFYYFKVEKDNVEPLRKGTAYVCNMLQSVITDKTRTDGIEGITAAVADPQCSVITVHKVDDLGRNIRITLVFNNDAYKKMMGKYGIFDGTSTSLIEHMR